MFCLFYGQATDVTLHTFNITEILKQKETQIGEMEPFQAILCHNQGITLIRNRNSSFGVIVVCHIKACLMIIETKSLTSVLQSALRSLNLWDNDTIDNNDF